MNWSEKQLEAIRTKDVNMLVSASAGSGKTAVLVERIAMLCVEEQVDIDRFLVVTFTKAAATEMRDRISKKLISMKAQGNHVHFINRQLSLLQNANISTLHSFCSNVIRSNFYEIDIDPNFKIADERNLNILSRRALDDVLSFYYLGANKSLEAAETFGEDSKGDDSEAAEIRKMINKEDANKRDIADFVAFSNSYFNYKNDDGLKEAILSLYHFSMAQPHPLKWLESAQRHDLKSIYLSVFDRFKEDLKIWIRDLQTLLLFCNAKNGLEKYSEAVIDDYTNFDEIYKKVDAFLQKWVVFEEDQKTDVENAEFPEASRRCENQAQLQRDVGVHVGRNESKLEFNTSTEGFAQECENLMKEILKFEKHKRFGVAKKDEADADVQNFVKHIRDLVKDEFKSYKERFFEQGYAQNQMQISKIEPHIRILSKLAMDYTHRFSDLKKEEKMVDFNDLEHMCIKILQNPDIAESYRKNIRYIFVDEYQDTNAVQEEITNLIKSGDNLFFVGDVKQSIYGFRMAEPQLFLDKFELYCTEKGNHRVDLNGNYRSSPAILHAINHIFDSLMSREFGGLDYKLSSRLEAGREDFELQDRPVLHLIAAQEKEEMELCESEAHYVASRIGELLKTPIFDSKKGEKRLPELNDIVILMRGVKEDAKVFQDILLKYGFASYTSEQSSFFEVPEVLNLINLLKVIDNPYEDIALLGVMRSVFGQFDDSELALIRLNIAQRRKLEKDRIEEERIEKDRFFYDDILEYIEAFEDEISVKLKKFTRMLSRYREYHYKKLSELVDFILEEHHYKYFVSSLSNSDVRLRYLEAFYGQILDFESANSSVIYHFVEYIEKIRNLQIPYRSESASTVSQQAIRIMSIHKSKGLEFPIVFLTRLAKRFNMVDLRSNILLDKKIQIAMRYLNKEEYEKKSNIVFEFVKAQMERKLVEEEQRLLYVALTRAVNRLECVMSFKDEEAMEKFYGANHHFYFSKEYMDFERADAEFWKFPSYDFDESFALLSDIRSCSHYGNFMASCIDFSKGDWNIQKSTVSKNPPSDLKEEDTKFHFYDIIKKYPQQEYVEYKKEYQLTAKKQGVTSFIKNQAIKEQLPLPDDLTSSQQLQSEKELKFISRLQAEQSVHISFGEEEFQPDFEKMEAQEKNGERFDPDLAIERGNAYHRALELLVKQLVQEEFSNRVESVYDLKEILSSFVKEGFLSQEYFEMLDLENIDRFFKSDLFFSLQSAQHIFVEKSFVYRIEESEGEILLQGVVDLMYVKDDEITIVDYKTDRASENVIKERYQKQIALYARALEEIINKKVSKRILYSIELGKSISV